MPKRERFEGVVFAEEHPLQPVAEHEVLMAFHGDADAELFREWWRQCGSVEFQSWIKKGER